MTDLFIIDPRHPERFEALKSALRFFHGEGEVRIQYCIPSEDIDVRPCTKEETMTGAVKKANLLLKTFLSVEKNFKGRAHAIVIQKGNNLSDKEKKAKLYCAASIESSDPQFSCLYLGDVRMAKGNKVRELLENGTELYRALGIVYGEEVEQKKISLYEKIWGISENSWIEASIKGVLLKLQQKIIAPLS